MAAQGWAAMRLAWGLCLITRINSKNRNVKQANYLSPLKAIK
jgi:hypothetical protein